MAFKALLNFSNLEYFSILAFLQEFSGLDITNLVLVLVLEKESYSINLSDSVRCTLALDEMPKGFY